MVTDLFPIDSPLLVVQGIGNGGVWVLHTCARCSALVRDDDIDRHTRWHQSVDTGATPLLPSDTKESR